MLKYYEDNERNFEIYQFELFSVLIRQTLSFSSFNGKLISFFNHNVVLG